MKTSKLCLTLLAVILSFSLNAARLHAEKAGGDLKQIYGTWDVTSFYVDGKSSNKIPGNVQYIFQREKIDGKFRDKLTLRLSKDGLVFAESSITFWLDEEKKPKRLHNNGFFQLYYSPENALLPTVGIYRLDKNELTIAGNKSIDQNQNFPNNFNTQPGNSHVLAILKRVKKKR